MDAELPLVLHIEDDLIAIELTKRALRSTCVIDNASNGETAVTMLLRNSYKAIIMDINLGREHEDGVEVTKKIRKIQKYQSTPIIAVTAYAMAGDKEEFLQAGCSHYLSKPFKIADLVNLVSDALAGK